MATHAISESGASVSVQRDDVIEVHLPENASTGYIWEVQSLPPSVHQLDSAMSRPLPTVPGQGGERVVTFRVGDPSPGELRLVLRRPWEDAAQPEATFTATIEPA